MIQRSTRGQTHERAHAPARRSGARAGLVVAAVAIVLGILGMHSLNLHHATGGAGMTGMTGMSSDPLTHADAVGPAAPRVDALAPGHAPEHGMGDMMMLCVAMLAAAGIALLGLLLLRTVPRAAWATTRPRWHTVLDVLVPARTGTGPPPEWAFSVVRC